MCMSLSSAYSTTEAAILSRVIDAETPSLAPDAARSILALDFQAADRERMEFLSAKAAEGTLTSAEREEIESYNHVGHLLALLQSKARLSLKKAGLPSDV